MSAISDRISQLSSVASVFNSAAAGAPTDMQGQSDIAHGARVNLDEMTRLMLIATRTSTGGAITSTGTANQVAFSTGAAPFGLASTRYACSGQP
jgi:hypothetical protein